jgi:hypothetical protein
VAMVGVEILVSAAVAPRGRFPRLSAFVLLFYDSGVDKVGDSPQLAPGG